MTTIANTRDCRLLSAAHCAYSIDPTTGKYTPPDYFNDAVGWLPGSPIPISGGAANDIDACLVGVNSDDGIILAFRGTLPPALDWASFFDWAQNIFMVAPIAAPPLPGKVHEGFWHAIQAIWSPILTEVLQLQTLYPGRSLYITGHSKGGAMAILAAALLAFSKPADIPQPAAVVTFAAPHAGDSTFAAHFPLAAIPVTPYENYLDLVPFLPPTQVFFEAMTLLPDLPSWLTNFFNQAAGWNYTALNTIYYYIETDHKIVPNTIWLTVERVAEIVEAMVLLEYGAIANAHATACGSGYITGVCPFLQCSSAAS